MTARESSNRNGRPKRPHRKPTLDGLGPVIEQLIARGVTVVVLVDDETEEQKP